MKKTLVLASAILSFAAAPGASAQAAHPDFAGTFALDTARSDHGPAVPATLAMRVVQSANELVVTRTQAAAGQESTATLHYALDGSTSTNEFVVGQNAVQASTVVRWNAGVPTFDTTLHVGEAQVKQMDIWSLADGGRTLVIERTLLTGGQMLTVKLVLARTA